MKCLTVSQIEEFINRGIADEKITEHIETCEQCYMNFQEIERGKGNYVSRFIKKVEDGHDLSQIMKYEREEEDNTVASPQKKRFPKTLLIRMSQILMSAIVMFALFMFIYTALPKAPDSYSLLTAEGVTDDGLLRGEALGAMFNPNISKTDGNIRLQINEVSADGSRIVMAVQLTDKKGNPVHYELNSGRSNHIYVKDGEDKVIAEMLDGGKTSDFLLLSAVFPETIETEQLKIEGNIYYLGNPDSGSELLNGDWSFQFTVDLTNLNKQTEVQTIDKKYELTKGLFIHVSELIRTPTSARMNIEIESTQKESSAEVQELSFHFEDAKGGEIHSVGSTVPGHKIALLNVNRTKSKNTGNILFSYLFIDIPKNATFVLDGAVLNVEDGSKIEFTPKELASGDVMFNHGGDELYLREMDEEKGNSFLLKIDGFIAGDILGDQWILQKKGSQEVHKLSYRGAFSPSGKGNHIDKGSEFVVEGLSSINEDDVFVLTRLSRSKKLATKTWSFQL